MKQIINDLVNNYVNRRIVVYLFLGMSSGIPFMFIVSTSSFFLLEAGYPVYYLSYLSLATIPYSVKPIYAKVYQFFARNYLKNSDAFQNTFLLLIQVSITSLVCFFLVFLVLKSFTYYLILSVILSLLSAFQDLVIDNIRINRVELHRQGYAIAFNSMGYRIGMMLGGGLICLTSLKIGWDNGFLTMAILLGGLSVTNFFLLKNSGSYKKQNTKNTNRGAEPPSNSWKEFFSYKYVIIYRYIFLFKVGDIILAFFTMPILFIFQFSKENISILTGVLEIILTSFGVLMSAYLASLINVKKINMIALFGQLCIASIFVFTITFSIIESIYFLILLKAMFAGLNTISLGVFISSTIKKLGGGIKVLAFLSSASSISRIIIVFLAGQVSYYLTVPSVLLVSVVFSLLALLYCFKMSLID